MKMINEQRIIDTVNLLCRVSPRLDRPTDRDGPFTESLRQSKLRQAIYNGLLTEAGWNVTVLPFEVKDGTATNLVASSSNPLERYRLFSCHSDYCAGQGVNDNISGMAVTIELARMIIGTEASRFCRFGAFDMEERGLLGSAAFVENSGGPLPVRVTNVDAISGTELFVTENHKECPASGECKIAAWRNDTELRLLPREHFPISSDHVPFLDAAIPATTIIGFTHQCNDILMAQTDASQKYKQLMAECSTANKPTDLPENLESKNMVNALRMLLRMVLSE